MGLDNGAVQFQSDPAAGFKAGIAFLDGVSAEKKRVSIGRCSGRPSNFPTK